MARVERKTIGMAGRITKLAAAIPTGLPPVLRSAWGFAQKMAKEFARHLLHPEEREAEFLERVRRYF